MHGPVISNSSDAPTASAEQTVYLWGIAIAAALGGLLFGYDWVVIGGARQFYEIYFHLTSPSIVGWANSCALAGCLLGSLAAGVFADHYGRRRTLLAAAVLFGISSVLTGCTHSFNGFIVWRILGGVAIGLSSNVSPLYIAEVSPAAIRGRLVSLNQFAIVVGILLAQVTNWRIARPVAANLSASALLQSWNVQYGWRWMFIVIAIPALIFAIASLFLPESPRWLQARGREAEAQDVLARIGGQAYAIKEITAIRHALKEETLAEPSSWRELFRPGIRNMLLLGIALAVLQQWTGINTLFNYAGDVYRSAGYGANQIFFDIVITGTINLLFTILSMLLVDRAGRRILMLLGCLGIAASNLACAFAYRESWPSGTILFLTLTAISCYALTLAPITWVLIAEIFPNRVRSHGVSAAVSALWIASFLLTYTFPALNKALGTGGVFFGYGAICLLGSVLVWRFVPETKGRTLEQIEASITKPRSSH